MALNLSTASVISELEDAGMDASVIDDGENSPYLSVSGKSYTLTVHFHGDIEETVNLDQVWIASRSHQRIDPWNDYRVEDLDSIEDLDTLVSTVDALTR